MFDCRDQRGVAVSGRSGASVLEFIGLFAAMAGGLALGSVYLGIDVKGAAQRLVNRRTAPTVLATPTPPLNPPAAASPAKAPQALPANSSAAGSAEAESHKEPTAITPLQSLLASSGELTEEQQRQATHAYWEALNGYMKREVEHRTQGANASEGWTLYDHLQARSEGHEAAAKGIEQLDANGVDSHALAYGEKALAWHQEGAKLYARAKELLTDAPTAQLSGPFAQSWQSAATQHQMEERLLAEKREAVRSYLDHQGGPKE